MAQTPTCDLTEVLVNYRTEDAMKPIFWCLVLLASLVVVGILSMTRNTSEVIAQTRKPVVITRLYTGQDGQTHIEEVEVKLAGDPQNEISKMFKVTGAEIHRAPAGRVNDWHVAPRRQFVITLSGRGEIEVAGGKKLSVGPGNIELAEDLTGKGHITRVVGTEERVTIQLPLADQRAGSPW
jgi:quercetin dioxygenase-like cupin family protein